MLRNRDQFDGINVEDPNFALVICVEVRAVMR
jgi:hypothetical protein